MNRNTWQYSHRRLAIIIMIIILLLLALIGRLIDLAWWHRDFLLKQSQDRIQRTLVLPASRGIITDRNNTPLAISAPVQSLWINPQQFDASAKQLTQLASLLKIPSPKLKQLVLLHKKKHFYYISHQTPPAIARQIKQLGITGIYAETHYHRFYPYGATTAHLLGITDWNDHGLEGLELAYNTWLTGQSGKQFIHIDRHGQIIANTKNKRPPIAGHTLQLSIDQDIQFSAYQALHRAINDYDAQSASAVVLDVQTGELLAMVNLPSYNPNNPKDRIADHLRNRAVTDMFEPGSTMKPFNVAFALDSGQYQPQSLINTAPGYMWIGGYKIKDDGFNFGKLTLTQVLQKSSNIGAAKILLSLKPQQYWHFLDKMGFGQKTASSLPGEADGQLPIRGQWQPSVIATLAYGYGIAVTTLQLAHAYAIIANHGISVPVTILKPVNTPIGQAVLNKQTAEQLVHMLESVTQTGGTGTRASIQGYRIAGKTGTAYIAGPQGYDKQHYTASFVGIAPASHPRFVLAIVIHDPLKQHFGGQVAAPVFATIMHHILIKYDIKPDNLHAKKHPT